MWLTQFKCFQSEAKQSLGTIAKNQDAYLYEFGVYADSLDKLSFTPKGEIQRYTYSLSPSKTGYTATATSKSPGITKCGEGDDIWTINERLELKNVRNASQDLCFNLERMTNAEILRSCLPAIIFIILYLCYDLYRFIRQKIMKKIK